MEIFNKIKKKLIIILVVLVLVNFVFAKPVSAKSFLASAGGKLIEPICELMVFLGDVVIDSLQNNFITPGRVIIQANSSEESDGITSGTVAKYAIGTVALIFGGVLIASGVGSGAGAAVTVAGIKTIAGGVIVAGAGSVVAGSAIGDTVAALQGEFDLPNIIYTPFAIFANYIPVFNINFFSTNQSNSDNQMLDSGAILQKTVSSWYVTFRNIAIIGLLCVLVYIGIRIIIGSASDKAKYKEMLMDWLIAMCLIFVMHYIMIFIVSITETVGGLFANNCTENIIVELNPDTKIDGIQLESDPEIGKPVWATNFLGYSRLIAGGYSDYDTMVANEYRIIYVVLVIYTVVFTIMYLKRVLYMAFLTMIAPLVALTYPIDKINDGKAQGFDTWLKEYIFNALLQPFHMLIYSLVVGSAMDLAMDHPIYALVALGFLIPAEKILRKMFGFEKAQTASAMGALGVAGAGMIMSGIHKLSHGPKKRRGDEDDKKSEKNNVRMKENDFDEIGNYVGEGNAGVGLFTGGRNGVASQGNNNNDSSSSLGSGISSPNNSAIGDIGGQNMFNQGTYTPKGKAVPIVNSNGMTGNANTKKKKTLRNRVKNGLMSVGARYSRKLAKSHPLRALAKGAAYGFGALSLGTAGMVAGIASGDLGKTAQYGMTAGAIGGKLGGNLEESLAYENRQNVEAFKKGWYGDEYADKLREEEIKKLQSDPENVQYLRERTSDYSQILKDAFPEYASYGCTNIEDFWAAYQMEQAGYSRESAISTYKLAQRIGDISNSPDAESKWEKKLDEEFGNTAVVQAQQHQLNVQYELQQKKAEAEFEARKQAIEDSKDREVEYQKWKSEREKQMKHIKDEYEARKKAVANQFSKAALNDVKQFYKNL